MRKILDFFSFVGIVGVLAGCAYAANYQPTEEERVLNEAWDFVCNVDNTFDCTGVEKPMLVLHDGVNQQAGTLGFYYPGEPIIFAIRNSNDEVRRLNVVVHELAHYLSEAKGWDAVEDSCRWEAQAFEISDKHAIYAGRPELVRGPEWWKPYWQCQHLGE